MFHGNSRSIFQFSILMLFVASSSSSLATANITNTTKAAAVESRKEITRVSSATAPRENLKKDTSEGRDEARNLVEASVDVAGPKTVKTETLNKVDKRESQDVKDKSSSLRRGIVKEKRRDVDEVSARRDENNETEYDEPEDAESGNMEERRDLRNEIEIGEEDEDEERVDGQAPEDGLEDDSVHHYSKRGGRPSRQGPRIWDQWGRWSGCSVSCGFGKLTRWRHCIGGSCSLGEKEAQLRTCTFAAC